MVEPPWRLLAVIAASAALLVLPATTDAATAPSISVLQSQSAAIANEQRSAILDLYSLDSRLAAANARLVALSRSEAALRSQRRVLETELRLARLNSQVAQHRLAERLRVLYDHGPTTSIDLFFGATSLADALTELDNMNRLTSMDGQILVQLRAARRHELRTEAQLGLRQAKLDSAIRAASAETRNLASVRAQRSAYISQLASRHALNTQQIAGLEVQAEAARAKAETLAAPATTPVVVPAGNTITVESTGYCLTGTTATGIPVGLGVVAVDPRVIPLGTHLTIPGYGEAVAADTGGAIIGNRIDLWFPTCAQASGWGWQSVTIALH